jgi:chorismate dehydratase
MKTRIGSVPYLNARPLVHYFLHHETDIEVIEEVPSRLAALLEAGEIHAALVSSIELVRQPAWGYVPGIAIATNGAVESVRMLGKFPPRSVALDTSSLTSVALLKILLQERFHLTPTYQSLPPDLDTMLTACDAALLIGDKGYKNYGEQIPALDLGEEWTKWTGLPFVWAAWIAPKAHLTPELCATLTQAKAWGLAHLDDIITTEAARHGETEARARHYLTEVMHFDLDEKAEAGLMQFLEKAKNYV